MTGLCTCSHCGRCECATRREQLIAHLDSEIVAVEQEIRVALIQDEQWAAAGRRLHTIRGIGMRTTAWILVATVNVTLCERAEQATAYAGLAPNPYQSGTSVRGRTSIGRGGNTRLRRVLYLATLLAARHNPTIKALYERLRAAGKPPKVARCAAARKLLHTASGPCQSPLARGLWGLRPSKPPTTLTWPCTLPGLL